MAPTLDRMMGVLLNVDVGPMIDAADPYRRTPATAGPADDRRHGRQRRSLFPGSHARLALRGHRRHGTDDAGHPFRGARHRPFGARDGGCAGNSRWRITGTAMPCRPPNGPTSRPIRTTDFSSQERGARSWQMTVDWPARRLKTRLFMWQLYQFPLCPFSRKVRLMLTEKGVPHELMRVSPWLQDDDFADLNPGRRDAGAGRGAEGHGADRFRRDLRIFRRDDRPRADDPRHRRSTAPRSAVSSPGSTASSITTSSDR